MFLSKYVFQCPNCKTSEIVGIKHNSDAFVCQCPKCNNNEIVKMKPIRLAAT
ncbi:hypothetical protein ACFLVP_04085 [Chloroflexota bacterium]